MPQIGWLLGTALVAGVAMYGALAVYVWRHRDAVGGRSLTLLLVAVGVWTLCYAVELSVDGRAAAERWGDLKYLGIVALTPGLWAFALQYTGLVARLSRRAAALLLVEPVAVLVLLAVPATHDLVRHVPPGDGYAAADPGPLFWGHLVYSYALLLGACGVMLRRLMAVSRRHRRPAAALTVAVVLPLVANAAYNLRVGPLGQIDGTPLAFTVTAVVFVWGFFRFRLLDVLPTARGVVVETMSDGLLVVDVHGRVVDANPAARHLVGSAADPVGRPALEVVPLLAGWPDSAEWRHDGRDVEVRVSALPEGPAGPTGRLVALRDVTARRTAERESAALLAERTAVLDVLERSLQPAPLPDVPGVEVAVAFQPARTELQVGGDFYDVQPAVAGSWSVVVGDVMGKGAPAAAMTSVVRHTVSVLARLGWTPSQLLTGVDEAIAVREGEEVRFCTAACVQLVPGDGAADLVLALGGHPQPVLRRADGTTGAVGEPGTLLGVRLDLHLTDVPLTLAAGDVLCLYSDGVLDARRGREPFGEERLLAAVAGAPGTAKGVVEAVTTALEEFADGRPVDDVVVLCLAVR